MWQLSQRFGSSLSRRILLLVADASHLTACTLIQMVGTEALSAPFPESLRSFFFPEIVQEVIKEMAQTAPVIGAKAKMGFKLVVLNEVERLSKPAQHALRRTMEKYMATCRFDMRN